VSGVRSPAETAGWADDPTLRDEVLHVYHPHCRYLLQAEVGYGVPAVLRAEFEIDESCYIADTGHFNAVEFNICYNQMLYYLVAKLTKEGAGPFGVWSPDDFRVRQLPDFLIVDFQSRFRRAIRGRRFRGELRLERTVQRGASGAWKPMMLLYTTCSFADEDGEAAAGKVRAVVLDPPAEPS
jgi:hypothetical protein